MSYIQLLEYHATKTYYATPDPNPIIIHLDAAARES
jgi:hypothetical protein